VNRVLSSKSEDLEMLLLLETPAGYALFKVLKPGKLEDVDKIWEEFQTPDKAANVVKLKAFAPFENTTEAVVAATSIIESTLDKSLKKFLKKNIISKEVSDELAVADIKLGGLIKEKMEIQCVCNETVMELFRGVRTQMETLLGGTEGEGAMKAMQLGLSHSLSRYKLKFSADKVDIMIVQAIGLLDDLDKEINIYAMRVREWYGWHFPEMAKIMNDNMFYAKCVQRMGMRVNCKNCDFSDILGDETLEETLKKTAETSMGTEISESDLENILSLCQQVVSLSEYRLQLFEYLKNRMSAIAPNLTVMVGELVGARLIAHAGSLLNLAKHPASTIQILGAEKALFRALKTKHDTPKYGLIYHASLIGQAAPKNKGKISRVLAAKTALAIRVDAMGENTGPTIAIDNRIKVESRIRQLEGGAKSSAVTSGKSTGPAKYDAAAARALAPPKFNDASDIVVKAKKDKKREREEDAEEEEEVSKKKKSKTEEEDDDSGEKKKKKKKDKSGDKEEVEEEAGGDDEGEKKKKKKKKDKKDE
jgi:nucleolar protein 58